MKVRKILIPIYSGNIVGDALVSISEQCLECRHLNSNRISCFAFPEGIPEKILSGNFNHKKPFEGDNGIQFEKKK